MPASIFAVRARSERMSTVALTAFVVLLTALVAAPAAAQEYGVYLRCRGEVSADGRQRPAHVDLALRRNSSLALLQASDILPAGQSMRLSITPQFYTMVYRAPVVGSVVHHDWWHGVLLVWSPSLRQIHTVRLAVDRRDAKLEGELLDGAGRPLGKLAMQCEPSDNETVAPPKF